VTGMRLFAVVGPSGAGKTTFLLGLIAELGRRGRVSAAIKHCGSGFDLGGRDKDSALLLRAGAEAVTLAGPTRLIIRCASRAKPTTAAPTRKAPRYATASAR